MISDHDRLLRIGQIDPDDRIRRWHQNTQSIKSGVPDAGWASDEWRFTETDVQGSPDLGW